MGSYIFAQNNGWNPVPPQRVYFDGTSNIDYLYYWQGKAVISGKDQQFKVSGDDFFNDLKYVMSLRFNKNYSDAFAFYKSLFNKYSTTEQNNKIISELGELYKESKSDLIKAEISQLFNEKETNLSIHPVLLETLANINFYDNNYEEATNSNKKLISEYAGTVYEKNARLNLFSIYYIQGKLDLAGKQLYSISKEYANNDEVLFAKWLLNKENEDAFRSEKVSSNSALPDNYYLLGNYPNPFNPSTTISYALPYQSTVELTIYDIMGRVVQSFNVSQSAGTQNIIWDGTNSNGENVSSGVYIYRLKLKSLENNIVFEKSAKLVMLK